MRQFDLIKKTKKTNPLLWPCTPLQKVQIPNLEESADWPICLLCITCCCLCSAYLLPLRQLMVQTPCKHAFLLQYAAPLCSKPTESGAGCHTFCDSCLSLYCVLTIPSWSDFQPLFLAKSSSRELFVIPPQWTMCHFFMQVTIVTFIALYFQQVPGSSHKLMDTKSIHLNFSGSLISCTTPVLGQVPQKQMLRWEFGHLCASNLL
jgi:hypothetical protein